MPMPKPHNPLSDASGLEGLKLQTSTDGVEEANYYDYTRLNWVSTRPQRGRRNWKIERAHFFFWQAVRLPERSDV